MIMSEDRLPYVTAEMFQEANVAAEKRFDAIETSLTEIKSTLSEMRYELRQHEHDMNHMQTTVYWGFAIMALVIAFIGCVITLAPMLRDMYHDRKREKAVKVTRSEIEEIVRSILREQNQ